MDLLSPILDLYLEKWILILLVFVRISGIFIISPVFRLQSVPFVLKVFFALILSVMIVSTLNIEAKIDFELWSLIFLVNKELFTGMIIGFAINLVFWGMRFGGGIIDYEMGFFAASLLSFSETTPTIFGEFLEWTTLMLFFLINGHHQIFEALYVSFAKIPIGMASFSNLTMQELGKFMSILTIIALKISAPIFVSTFLINISLAMLSRMAPQTNIFVVSFQVKIAVALLVFFLAISFFVYSSKQFLEIFQNQTYNLLQSIG
jgi:flagellar biosynthetic protein FliR